MAMITLPYPNRSQPLLVNVARPWEQGSWGLSGARRTQMGPMWAPWTLPFGQQLAWCLCMYIRPTIYFACSRRNIKPMFGVNNRKSDTSVWFALWFLMTYRWLLVEHSIAVAFDKNGWRYLASPGLAYWNLWACVTIELSLECKFCNVSQSTRCDR